MAKQKPLLPSLREKRRYLAFQVISKEGISNSAAVKAAVLGSFAELFGSIDLGKAGVMFLNNKFNKEKQKGLIGVNHMFVDKLRASLAFCKSIDSKEAVIRSIGVSGVINKAEGYLA